jgi:hypothetical protein
VYQQDLVGEGDAELAIPPSEISSREQTPPEELRSDDENKYEAGADTAGRVEIRRRKQVRGR